MLLISVLATLYLLADSVSSTLQHNLDGQTLQSPTTNLTSDYTYSTGLPPSNKSLVSLHGLATSETEITCFGTQYGFEPNINDCWNAINYVQRSQNEVTFAERDTSPPPGIFRLPFRFMGDQAQCYFQPALKVGERTGSASFNEIRAAATALVTKCGLGARQGGIANHISSNDHLGLVMATYTPTIQCTGTLPRWPSCRDILFKMPATPHHIMLGPRTDYRSQVILPQILPSRDERCQMEIYSGEGLVDSSTWYKIWEAATAVYSVCARHNRGGMYSSFGDKGRLSITLTSTIAVEDA